MVLEFVRVDLRIGQQCEQLRNGEYVRQHDEVLQLDGLISEEVPTNLPLLWESACELGLQLSV